MERFGKFHRILEPGLSFLLPLVDRIKYVQSLKENTVEIPTQSAITQDNVTLEIDGVLYFRIEDPYKGNTSFFTTSSWIFWYYNYLDKLDQAEQQPNLFLEYAY